MEVLRWAREHNAGLGEDLEQDEAKEGLRESERLRASWKKQGWPGPLWPENERTLEWAYLAEGLGVGVADETHPHEAAEGNESLVRMRQMVALGFVKHRAHEAGRKAAR